MFKDFTIKPSDEIKRAARTANESRTAVNPIAVANALVRAQKLFLLPSNTTAPGGDAAAQNPIATVLIHSLRSLENGGAPTDGKFTADAIDACKELEAGRAVTWSAYFRT